ncbi:MAG TPA: phospholipase D-like domain-containing protein [Terracidiphilus sp.]|nr:phospholipase D-like domain-containing protein [Terracidiphilus sp.]
MKNLLMVIVVFVSLVLMPSLVSADVGTVNTFWAPDANLKPTVLSLIGSATTSVYISSNDLVDADIVGSLCSASTRISSVVAVLNLSGGTARSIAARSLNMAGVEVLSSTMTNTIPNHLLIVDGGTVGLGNFYWSDSAQQIGSYLSLCTVADVIDAANAQFDYLYGNATPWGGDGRVRMIRPKRCPYCPMSGCVGSIPDPQVWFSPNGGCEEAIQASLLRAKLTVRAQVYTATSVGVFQSLIAAHRRGVDVQVVADRYCSSLPKSQVGSLAAAGVPVYLDSNEKIMHDKTLVIDDEYVFTGSFNFSEPAEHSNAENLVLFDSPVLASAYSADWLFHRNHSDGIGVAAGLQFVPPLPPRGTLNRFSPPTHVRLRWLPRLFHRRGHEGRP